MHIAQSDINEMAEYISKMGSRIHKLEDDSMRLMNTLIDKQDNLHNYREYFQQQLRSLNHDALDLSSEMDASSKKISKVIEMFKSTIRKDRFTPLQESAYSIDFEFFMTREEVRKLLQPFSEQR